MAHTNKQLLASNGKLKARNETVEAGLEQFRAQVRGPGAWGGDPATVRRTVSGVGDDRRICNGGTVGVL